MINRKTPLKSGSASQSKKAVDANIKSDGGKDDIRFLLLFATLSRIAVISLAVFANQMASDYDTSTNLLLFEADMCSSSVDRIVLAVCHPFIHWDAFYNLDIALNSYSLEQQFAFFPGIVVLLRIPISSSDSRKRYKPSSIMPTGIC
jgi:Mannosyltransferase (PIG-V)